MALLPRRVCFRIASSLSVINKPPLVNQALRNYETSPGCNFLWKTFKQTPTNNKLRLPNLFYETQCVDFNKKLCGLPSSVNIVQPSCELYCPVKKHSRPPGRLTWTAPNVHIAKIWLTKYQSLNCLLMIEWLERDWGRAGWKREKAMAWCLLVVFFQSIKLFVLNVAPASILLSPTMAICWH